MKRNHLIGKQLFEVSIGSSRKAYAVQQSISELFWQRIVPELDLLFGRLVSDDELIVIDKMVLDIGNISLKEDDINELISRIIEMFEQEFMRIEFKSSYSHSANDGIKARAKQPVREHFFDLWLYWLEQGVLPSYIIRPEENWIQQVLETLALEHRAISQLEKISKRSPVVIERLVLQHDPKDLKSLVEIFTGFSQDELLTFFEELFNLFERENVISSSKAIRDVEVTFWANVFVQVIVNGRKEKALQLCAELLRLPVMNDYNVFIKEVTFKKSGEYSMLEKVLNVSSKMKQETSIVSTSTERTKERAETELEEMVSLENQVSSNSLQFFKNAGVILIHTFLSQFFKKIDLTEGKEFRDVHCQSKAALLIHYLATGQEKVPEYDMILPKFLCEIPPNVPLDHLVRLTVEEREEANNLLQAAIDHWGALGNTSPDGLREGFLQREGKLLKEETGWKLYIEQKAQDLLIDRLPWNISLVKLPWMKELLRVEWR